VDGAHPVDGAPPTGDEKKHPAPEGREQPGVEAPPVDGALPVGEAPQTGDRALAEIVGPSDDEKRTARQRGVELVRGTPLFTVKEKVFNDVICWQPQSRIHSLISLITTIVAWHMGDDGDEEGLTAAPLVPLRTNGQQLAPVEIQAAVLLVTHRRAFVDDALSVNERLGALVALIKILQDRDPTMIINQSGSIHLVLTGAFPVATTRVLRNLGAAFGMGLHDVCSAFYQDVKTQDETRDAIMEAIWLYAVNDSASSLSIARRQRVTNHMRQVISHAESYIQCIRAKPSTPKLDGLALAPERDPSHVLRLDGLALALESNPSHVLRAAAARLSLMGYEDGQPRLILEVSGAATVLDARTLGDGYGDAYQAAQGELLQYATGRADLALLMQETTHGEAPISIAYPRDQAAQRELLLLTARRANLALLMQETTHGEALISTTHLRIHVDDGAILYTPLAPCGTCTRLLTEQRLQARVCFRLRNGVRCHYHQGDIKYPRLVLKQHTPNGDPIVDRELLELHPEIGAVCDFQADTARESCEQLRKQLMRNKVFPLPRRGGIKPSKAREERVAITRRMRRSASAPVAGAPAIPMDAAQGDVVDYTRSGYADLFEQSGAPTLPSDAARDDAADGTQGGSSGPLDSE
jgi:hypothetical protein